MFPISSTGDLGTPWHPCISEETQDCLRALGWYAQHHSSLDCVTDCCSSCLWQKQLINSLLHNTYLCFHFRETIEWRASLSQQDPVQCFPGHLPRQIQTQWEGNPWGKPWLCHTAVIFSLNPESVQLYYQHEEKCKWNLNDMSRHLMTADTQDLSQKSRRTMIYCNLRLSGSVEEYTNPLSVGVHEKETPKILLQSICICTRLRIYYVCTDTYTHTLYVENTLQIKLQTYRNRFELSEI